jgi:hypothetical protein
MTCILVEDHEPLGLTARKASASRADPDRARDPRRDPSCDRRAHAPGPGARRIACSRAERCAILKTHPRARADHRRRDPLRCLPGAVPHPQGAAGACDRYANEDGKLVRLDPLLILQRGSAGGAVPRAGKAWSGNLISARTRSSPDRRDHDLSGLQARAFIVSSKLGGVDVVTVVTEGIFSYCGSR